MEELGISRACQINNINFYPMNEECITLSEYLEIMRNKKLIPEFKNILDSQKAMKASILSLITTFKGQNYECFKCLDENGNWDFTWLDNAPIEVIYNLFRSCVQLVIGLKQQFDGEDYLRKQIADLFNSIVPKKNDESEKLSSERKLQYIMPDTTLE